MKTPDIITSDDLSGLRADLGDYAACEMFSIEFRETCREAIAAIDVAITEDIATNIRLQHALERFVRVGTARLKSC